MATLDPNLFMLLHTPGLLSPGVSASVVDPNLFMLLHTPGLLSPGVSASVVDPNLWLLLSNPPSEDTSPVVPQITLEIRRLTPPSSVTYITSDVVAGLSSPIALPTSTFTVRLLLPAPVGSSWTIMAALPPAEDPIAILTRIDALDDQVKSELFGTDSTEPYSTLRALWETSDDAPVRLGSIALALAYRTAALQATRGQLS
jgi:hypothetical protein